MSIKHRVDRCIMMLQVITHEWSEHQSQKSYYPGSGWITQRQRVSLAHINRVTAVMGTEV